jgi:hypothetical protein
METTVDSAGPRYFRCLRMAATITPRQCRANRERCALLEPLFDLFAPGAGEPGPPCQDCPQATQVDAGQVRFFSAPEVLAGHARAESSPRDPLPWEHRQSARPSDRLAFTSAFWVPEWEF